jgi:7-cyano-7-deazaguanine synthase
MKAISLLSSGIDSLVALRLSIEELEVPLALTFDYGQVSRKREVEYSSKICEILGLDHKVIRISWLKEITRSGLIKGDIPEVKERDLDSKLAKETAKQVWVPNRNGLFINIGACFAEAMGAKYIITGFDAEEAATFPDNSMEFVEAVNNSLSYSTLTKVEVFAPLVKMSKTDIVLAGMKYEAPLEWSWSCYFGGEKPCLKCESCVRRSRAFNNAGIKDPLLERLGI